MLKNLEEITDHHVVILFTFCIHLLRQHHLGSVGGSGQFLLYPLTKAIALWKRLQQEIEEHIGMDAIGSKKTGGWQRAKR
jgi:hypothetical protein